VDICAKKIVEGQSDVF